MNKLDLVKFEARVAELFRQGGIRCPIHLSSGNEEQLIKVFKKIRRSDYVFSTHRNHLHYLLHTGDTEGLLCRILAGDSMHTCSPMYNFYTSSIVSGCVAIACGAALALKLKKSKQKVWVFVGDAATDEGWFIEAVRYAYAHKLPITYVVEDNNRSVCSTKEHRWHGDARIKDLCRIYHPVTKYYSYTCEYPHAGLDEWVNLEGDK